MNKVKNMRAFILMLCICITLFSCKEEEEFWNKDYIIAGDPTQIGLRYNNPTNTDINRSDSNFKLYSVDLDGDNISDFKFEKGEYYDRLGSGRIFVKMTGLHGNSYILVDEMGYGYAEVLEQGDTIRTNDNYINYDALLYAESYSCTLDNCNKSISGFWGNVQYKCIGIKYRDRLGWIRIGLTKNRTLKIYDSGIIK